MKSSCSFFALVLLISSFAHAQSYMEEIATLESVYETRARSALNTLLRPDEYSIVVSAEISRDPGKIQKYRDEIDANSLPGMPHADPEAGLLIGGNELEDLKSNIQVHLVLTKGVDEAKEQVITQILRSKLHLDTDMGDKIIIQRTKIALDKPRLPASAKPLPEPNWKLGLLVGGTLLGLLLLLLVWVFRKQKLQEPEARTLPETPQETYTGAEENQVGAASPESEDEKIDVSDEVHLHRIETCKTQLIAMSEELPFLVVSAAADYFKQGHEKELMILFQTLGWDVARKHFNSLPEKIWAQLGHLVETTPNDFKIQYLADTTSRGVRFILSKVLSLGKFGDDSSPFDFLFNLRSSERKLLLNGESAERLAIVGFCSSDEEFAEILQDLPPAQQRELIGIATSVETIPENSIQKTANYFMQKIEASKGKWEVEADGPSKAAKILRMLPADEEEEMFQSIAAASPNQAEQIRKKIIRFPDLPVVPQEILENVFADMDIDEIVISLTQQSHDTVNFIVGFLPAKKAKVVRGDLHIREGQTSMRERARVHRKVCLRIESMLKARGMSVEDAWKDRQKAL